MLADTARVCVDCDGAEGHGVIVRCEQCDRELWLCDRCNDALVLDTLDCYITSISSPDHVTNC